MQAQHVITRDAVRHQFAKRGLVPPSKKSLRAATRDGQTSITRHGLTVSWDAVVDRATENVYFEVQR